ncbi:hypothetical protein Q0Z83_047310 [Actinoplanes sichuanensis]|uniref:Uncharacterized protein n=1 Tax=Actinoplanes sichuanensis TaxID=512349 RepID=A0ABW4AA15_9ACTN|nr:hypothetical protein [Actinoplanes sichuanensis]BEL06540.1 hypothetical protein Q0Z83_047310 [Actinoplanes sichuanensis]
MAEVNTKDAAIEIEHILGGYDAHRRAHFWFSHGDRSMARDYLRLGSRHGVAAADEDLAVLDKSGDTRIAACTRISGLAPGDDSRSGWRVRLRPLLRWLTASAVLLILVSSLFAGIRARQTATHLDALPDTYVPTGLSNAPIGPRQEVALPTTERPQPAPTAGEHPRTTSSAQPYTTVASRPSTTAVTLPPSSEASVDRPASVSDPHLSVSQGDGSEESFSALVALSGKDGWRQLRFQPEAESRFVATLWSTDRTPCFWRFAGADGMEADAAETNSSDVVVPAGERRDTIVLTEGWPVLSVKVRGGDRVAGCLLVNQRFVEIEKAAAKPVSGGWAAETASSGGPVGEAPTTGEPDPVAEPVATPTPSPVPVPGVSAADESAIGGEPVESAAPASPSTESPLGAPNHVD